MSVCFSQGGGKAKNILADPIVEMVVGLIRPHVEPFKNMFDDNCEDNMIEMITGKFLSFYHWCLSIKYKYIFIYNYYLIQLYRNNNITYTFLEVKLY